MKLLNNVKEFLYDKKYYILLFDQYAYLFGVKKIVFVEKNLIKIEVTDFEISIIGDNLSIELSYDNELLIKGDIYEVKK